MKNTIFLGTLLVASLFVAGCNSGGGGGAQTTTQIAADEIAGNTSDNAAPLMLNDLPISAADTDETSKPAPVR